jgi:hypothetical protein
VRSVLVIFVLTSHFSLLTSHSSSAAPVQAAAEKVPIVAVAGCVQQEGDSTWMLTSATEPEPSIANGPPAGQPYKGPTSGKQSFRLIGVSEFDLPSHKGHTVLVKGLFIKDKVSRLNVTSVTMIAATCGK